MRALLHGEGVSIGMAVSASIAYEMGLCSREVVDFHYSYLEQTGLPVFIPEAITIEKIEKKLTRDKHHVAVPHCVSPWSLPLLYAQIRHVAQQRHSPIHRACSPSPAP